VKAKTLSCSVALSAFLLTALAVQAALDHQTLGFQDLDVWANTGPPGGSVTNFGAPMVVPIEDGASFHWTPSLLSPWGIGDNEDNVVVSGSKLEFIFSDAGFYRYSGRYVEFKGFSIYGVAPTSLGITSLSVAPETTMQGFGVSFEPNSITVDLTGVMFTVDYTEVNPYTGALIYPPETIVLDVGFTAVPEPSIWALVGLGTAALVIFRRRG